MTDDVVTGSTGEHASLPAAEVVRLLGSDARSGLTSAEAAQRLLRCGRNVLPTAPADSPLRRFLRQLQHPLVYVLLAAVVATAAIGELVDSSVILAVVVLNAVVGFLQESRAEAALEALRALVTTQARVVRDGRTTAVGSEDLVPGDLVRVEAGDKVPADLRLLEQAELRVDESALTGESVPVAKHEAALPTGTPVADRRNVLCSGTLVTAGTGTAVVVATGARTELGTISRLVGAAEVLATPLTRKLAHFSRRLTVVVLALAAATFAVGVARGEPAAEMLTAAVALAVGAIPEGLPAAVTITLAIGVSRMARRRAVVRRLPAVETLGSTTVICSDKTGTLTENQMTVRTVWTPQRRIELTGSGYAPVGQVLDEDGQPADVAGSRAVWWTLLTGALCNDARLVEQDGRWDVVGDPTEGALLTAAAKGGFDLAALRTRAPRLGAVPFSSERQYMATLHDTAALHACEDGSRVVLVKGSAERVLARCTAQLADDGSSCALDAAAALAQTQALAADGLRVLATAVRPVEQLGSLGDADVDGLTLTGLLAMLDPPRPAAAAAVAACHGAGIDVKMITGDHPATAAAIAARIGLTTGSSAAVLTGADLDRLDGDQLADAVERTAVFARTSPEQKLRLVEGMQRRGHVVAMTGDGVNDAPSLRQADIGIAMGRGGTQVAQEAADMVLTDDDFATIEGAVDEGRGVFDNLVKFLVWTLPTNMGEGLVILLAVLLAAELPMTPVQILWVNMTTAVALGLMLAFEPKEADIMQRPPRDPARPLLTQALVVRMLLVSALLVGGAWWLFTWERSSGASLEQARTAALNVFVTVEAFYLFSCRSLTGSVWSIGLFSNRWLLGGLAAQVLAQLAITYLPAMHRVFGTAPLPADAWLRILLVAVTASAVVAVHKRLQREVL